LWILRVRATSGMQPTDHTTGPQQPSEKQPDEMFCTSCGEIIKAAAEICVHCGVRNRGLGRTAHPNANVESPAVGDFIAIAPGVILAVASFLPWYHASVSLGILGSVSVNRSGWQSPGATWSTLAVVAAVATSILALLAVVGAKWSPRQTRGFAYLGGGIAIGACLGLKLNAFSSDLAIGFWVAAVGAVVAILAGLFQVVEQVQASQPGIRPET
jgi:hypothetical protein